MKYVLIIMMKIATGTSASITVSTAEFNNKQTCEKAMQATRDNQIGGLQELKLLCLKK